MSGFNFRFEFPWLLLTLIPVALLVYRSYRYTYRGIRRTCESRWPLLLRLSALLCVILMISGVSVITNQTGVETLIALDSSDSMRGQSQQARQDAEKLAGLLTNQGKVQQATFSQKFSREGEKLWGDAGSPAASNLSCAMVNGAEQMNSNRRRRVILLTDGRETDGDVITAAHVLSNQGVRVDAVCYDSRPITPEAEIASVDVPAAVSLGTVCQAVVKVKSNERMRATLAFYDGEQLVKEASVRLKKGETRFSYAIELTTPGLRTLTARLMSEQDTIPENNILSACVHVSVSGITLIVDGTGHDGEMLYELMHASGYQVERRFVSEFPQTMVEMCRYGLIVLMNVDEQSLREGSDKLLEEYLRVYGRSVLVTGGTNTYVYGHFLDTAFELFLPVRVDVYEKESDEETALVLVLDCSASMGVPMTKLHTATMNPLEMAKRGALKCASQLHDNDSISIISFSDEAYVMLEMTTASNREQVTNAVARMATMGGTQYVKALQAALNQFKGLPQDIRKHIIFLSDGNAGDTGFEQIAEAIHREEVTLTTIAVGDDVDVSVLKNLAELGHGRYYRVEDPYHLPGIMLADTVLQQVNCTVEEMVTPQSGVVSQLFDAGETLPELRGYIRTEAQAGAEVVLSTTNHRPIFTRWRYGEGLCGAFAADLGGPWSAMWLDTEHGREATLRLVESMMPESSRKSAVTATIVSGGMEGRLKIECPIDNVPESLSAKVTGPDGSVQNLMLPHKKEGFYEQTMALPTVGTYQLTLRPVDANGKEGETYETAAASAWSREYEAFPSQEEEETLARACQWTGGTVYYSVNEAAKADLSDMIIEYDPTLLLSLTAFTAVLSELMLRRTGRQLQRAFRHMKEKLAPKAKS